MMRAGGTPPPTVGMVCPPASPTAKTFSVLVLDIGPPTGMHPALMAVGTALVNFAEDRGCSSTKFLW